MMRALRCLRRWSRAAAAVPGFFGIAYQSHVVSPIEASPSKHAVAKVMFLYLYEPGGNRVEITTGTHFIYDPQYETVTWTEAERARGQAWGVRTIETFHTYGTPDLSGRATGPPIPPTSQVPG